MSSCRQATARLSSIRQPGSVPGQRRRWRSIASLAPVIALRSSWANPAASWPRSRCLSPAMRRDRSDSSSPLIRSTPAARRPTSSLSVSAAAAPNSPSEIRSTRRSIAPIRRAIRPVVASPSGTSTASVVAATASTGQAADQVVIARLFSGVSTNARSGRTPAARMTATAYRVRPRPIVSPSRAVRRESFTSLSFSGASVAAPGASASSSQTISSLPVRSPSASRTAGTSAIRERSRAATIRSRPVRAATTALRVANQAAKATLASTATSTRPTTGQTSCAESVRPGSGMDDSVRMSGGRHPSYRSNGRIMGA